jgi:hypothetical protein
VTVQPGPPQGGGGAVTSVFTRVGAVVAQAGDYTAAQVTNAADKSSGSSQAFTGEVSTPDVNLTGLTGSGSASRLVGATASGAPGSGAHNVGDLVIDQTGHVWICTVGGTPGTWQDAGPVRSVFGRAGAVAAQAGDYTAALVTNAADKSSGSQQAFAGEVAAPDFTPTGLTGSLSASRYVGATASGAPGSGAHNVGDWVVAQNGHIFVCTAAGTPGTWVDVAAGAAGPTGTNGTNTLGANQALGAIANTFVDAVTTGTIGANTQVFYVICKATITSGASAATITARIWDGSATSYDETAVSHGAAATTLEVTLQSVITLTAAVNIRLSVASTVANDGNILAAAPNNSSGSIATRISWVRLA